MPKGWNIFSIKAWQNARAYQDILNFARKHREEQHTEFICNMIKSESCYNARDINDK